MQQIHPGDPSTYVLPTRVGFALGFESAVFITETIGQKLPNSRYNIPSFIERHIGSKNLADGWILVSDAKIGESAQCG